MEPLKLTDQQSLRIAELPDSYRVVGVDGGAPFVRKVSGELMRIQRDGRLAAATAEAKRRLADRPPTRARRFHRGVEATTPYTSVMD